jgi:hypothetical protein
VGRLRRDPRRRKNRQIRDTPRDSNAKPLRDPYADRQASRMQPRRSSNPLTSEAKRPWRADRRPTPRAGGTLRPAYEILERSAFRPPGKLCASCSLQAPCFVSISSGEKIRFISSAAHPRRLCQGRHGATPSVPFLGEDSYTTPSTERRGSHIGWNWNPEPRHVVTARRGQRPVDHPGSSG